MKFIADLHIHSKYSRAVSKNMTLPELDRWADDKGILVMGTGDFLHPEWLKDIKTQLIPAEPGLFRLKPELRLPTIKGTQADTRFMLTVEISCIYSRGGKVRRVHVLIFAPDIPTVEKIQKALLAKKCNLHSDGRPIIGLDSVELLKIVLEANPQAAFVPAHAWTPWFSVFGSMSGFNSLTEGFGEYAKHIFAIETGLSSDPEMNWRVSALDKIAFISNSDSHSLERIGREANMFNTELSFEGIMSALRTRDPKQFVATLEYFPEEGKYHVDGHRLCGVSWTPQQTRENHGICTVCKKPVTVGVLNRLDKLADRPEEKSQRAPLGELTAKTQPGRVPFANMVTLDSIIGEALDLGVKTRGVKREYDGLINMFGSELDILMNVPLTQIQHKASAEIAEGIRRMRAGELSITPGFDGEYGIVKIFSPGEKKLIKSGPKGLFD